MTDQLRALLMDLTNELNRYHPLDADAQGVLNRARAALAQQEGEGLTNEKIEAEFRHWWKERYGSPYFGEVPLVLVIEWTRYAARFGRPAPQPVADGEVGELVKWLRAIAETLHEGNIQTPRLTRIADLLAQQHPQPIPVSERLPGPGDCDAEGRCWFGTPASLTMEANWVYRKAEHRRAWDTHLLPAHALPLPTPEPQP